MSNESVVPLFGTYDRDSGTLKGVGALGTPYSTLGGGGGSSTIAGASDYAATVQTPLANLNTAVSAKADAAATTTALATKADATATTTALATKADATATTTALAGKVATASVGAANGVASLGADSKVPVSQMTGKLATADLTDGASVNSQLSTIPTQALQVHAVPLSGGNWDASANNPVLASGTAPADNVYCRTVSVAGTTTIDGNSTWKVGDTITWNGTTWYRTATLPPSSFIKTDSQGNPLSAVIGVDYRAPVLLQTAIPIVMPPSGLVIGSNGAITSNGGIAFLEIYDACFMKFNVNEIGTGVAAGLYYTEMSALGVGTIYNVVYNPASGLPVIPTVKTAFSGTAGSTTAGSTSGQVVLQYSMPGNYLGKNGKVRYSGAIRCNNNANQKRLLTTFGAVSGFNVSTVTSTSGGGQPTLVQAKGATGKQMAYLETNAAGSSTAPGVLTQDTTQAITLALSLQTVVATDWATMIFGAIEVDPA